MLLHGGRQNSGGGVGSQVRHVCTIAVQSLCASVLATNEQTQNFPMPTCTYTIHADSPDGPPVRFSLVGQSVYHRWTCDDCTRLRTCSHLLMITLQLEPAMCSK
jgi:hypothetical protein